MQIVNFHCLNNLPFAVEDSQKLVLILVLILVKEGDCLITTLFHLQHQPLSCCVTAGT